MVIQWKAVGLFFIFSMGACKPAIDRGNESLGMRTVDNHISNAKASATSIQIIDAAELQLVDASLFRAPELSLKNVTFGQI